MDARLSYAYMIFIFSSASRSCCGFHLQEAMKVARLQSLKSLQDYFSKMLLMVLLLTFITSCQII